MAEQIYELVEKNTPVIVYGGKTLPPKKEEPEAVDIDLDELESPPFENVEVVPENPLQITENLNDDVPDSVELLNIDNEIQQEQ